MALISDAGLFEMGRRLGEASLGCIVLAGSENGATCFNGMPVAPGAVRMIGRLGRLQELEEHPLLTRDVAIIRCTTVPNAAILISEHYETSLEDLVFLERLQIASIPSVASQVCTALYHLHEKRIVVGLLDLAQVLVLPATENDSLRVRLAHFGLSFLSDDGRDLANSIGSAYTLSPERLLTVTQHTHRIPSSTSERIAPCSRKSDVWAYGIVLLQMISGASFSHMWTVEEWLVLMKESIDTAVTTPDCSLYDILIDRIIQSQSSTRGRIDTVTKEYGSLVALTTECLRLRPKLRPSIERVKDLLDEAGYEWENDEDDWSNKSVPEMQRDVENEDDDWVLKSLPIDDAFFLCTLSGSSIEKILLDRGVVKTKPSVVASAVMAVDDLDMIGNEQGRLFDASMKTTIIPMSNLREKLRSVDALSLLLHSFELNDRHIPSIDADLPVVVKEKDVSYQASRMSMLSHLLSSNAFISNDLLPSAVIDDVPPLRRAAVWRALLSVSPLDGSIFDELDTVSPHTSDRQLDVDIPRCHQYEEIMTSPSAHYKLKRLLKAWLHAHPRYVYWQGLDSLAAPFLLLNFENLPMALACMSSFIDRYLKDFFLKDNSNVIQEYLAVFNHLLSYVDASLYTCLTDMDFFPELFAIPWFLTCFAHVLPLHKLLHVWDALLRAETSFPLFVGVSVLLQMRPSLIGASFNDVILLFSDLPDLQIDRILSDTMELYTTVPRSCVHLAQRKDEGSDSMEELSVSELKSFSCPRLSTKDLIRLVKNEQIAIIDVRSTPEFYRGSVVRSVNYPNVDDVTLSTIRTILETAQNNKHPICIVDVKTLISAKKFSSLLVRNGVCGVCILDGGYDAIRTVSTVIHVRSANTL